MQPVFRRWRLCAVFLLFASSQTWAQSPKLTTAPPAEELRTAVARRIREFTGAEARIGELRYEILGSRFVGSEIEVGPRREPLVRIGNLTVELSLLSAASVLQIQRIEAKNVRAGVPAAWLERTVSLRPHRAARVRAASINGTVVLGSEQGSAAILDRVQLVARDLELPAGSDEAQLGATGLLTLRVGRITMGNLVVEKLQLHGKLQGDRLTVERLDAEILGGKLQLQGKLGLKAGRRPGPLELRGTLSLLLDGNSKAAPLQGRVHLFGRSLTSLQIEGSLSGPSPERQRGVLAGAPKCGVRLRLGARVLRGTTAAWEIR